VGYVPDHKDLARFYGAADAFVFPSLYEGFGLPVVEAMTCGCPVITSDRSSLPEVAGDAAEYVNPDDPGAIAEAMRRVLGDTDRRAGMCDRGLAQAKRFHWQECAQTTLDVYRRAAGCAS
jgi:glycosyltransferase involved in cell wall biosynthesis